MKALETRDQLLGGAKYFLTRENDTCRSKRDFFDDNLLVQIHLIIEMILVDRPCAMAVCRPNPSTVERIWHI